MANVSPIYTTDELVALLNQTSLPTILVEGNDDFFIYRSVEMKLGNYGISILPCDGRSTLLKVFERRSEFLQAKVAFVADRDMWLFTSIPSEYQEIIWTDGYSIENDLYEPSTIENLLSDDERVELQNLLSELAKWFAFEVEEFRAGRSPHVSIHPNKIVKPNSLSLCPVFCLERNYTEPYYEVVSDIIENYKLKFRGKNLFYLLSRCVSHDSRKIRYSYHQLMDMAFRLSDNNPRLNRIISEAQRILQVA